MKKKAIPTAKDTNDVVRETTSPVVASVPAVVPPPAPVPPPKRCLTPEDMKSIEIGQLSVKLAERDRQLLDLEVRVKTLEFENHALKVEAELKEMRARAKTSSDLVQKAKHNAAVGLSTIAVKNGLKPDQRFGFDPDSLEIVV